MHSCVLIQVDGHLVLLEALERGAPPIQAVQYIYSLLEAPETPGVKQVILGQLRLADSCS